MSRRQEIKRKEELQARFQLAISNNNQKALSWLKPHKDSSSTKLQNVENDTEDSFLNLQIIPQGLSLSCKKNENNQKIGEFLSSKDISKSKQQLNHQQQQHQGIRNKTNSKPMLALMNKMRDDNRKNIQRNHKSIQSLSNKKRFESHRQKLSNSSEDDDDDDEDDDDELNMRSRSAKKGSSLLLEQKLNKGNGKKKGIRPF